MTQDPSGGSPASDRKVTTRVVTTRVIERQQFGEIFGGWRSEIEKALVAGGGPPVAGPEPAPVQAGSTRPGDSPWALVGIKRRGAFLARRLWKDLQGRVPSILYGEVDISLYRDDYHMQTATPRVLGTEIPFRVDGVSILLVDDVLYTGRTVRAAMDLILDFGRPRVIELAVFVDRGHRELPIAADFVGKEVLTEPDDLVKVRLEELSETDGVELIRFST